MISVTDQVSDEAVRYMARTPAAAVSVKGLIMDAAERVWAVVLTTRVGLPPSLTNDYRTGVIHGIVSYDAVAYPDLSAVYSVTVSVSHGQLTTQVSFDWTVNDLIRHPLAVDDTADVFLNRLKAPKKMKLRTGSKTQRTIKVFGDGDIIAQDATVVLSAEAPDGVEVEIEESALTKTVMPGGRNTRFAFEVEIECEDQGSYEILWTATIDAAENADPSNDTLQAVSVVQCTKKKK